jgi:hypothetical protein
MVCERDADSQVDLIYLLWPFLPPSPPKATMHALTSKTRRSPSSNAR